MSSPQESKQQDSTITMAPMSVDELSRYSKTQIPSEHRKLTIFSLLSGDELVNIIATLEDGTEKTYKVQRALLVSTSDYFKKALGAGFQESKTNTLRFPGTHHQVVENFLYFLVYGFAPLCDRGGYDKETICIDSSFGVHMWVFADQCFIPKLKNQAMGYLYTTMEHCDGRIGVEAIRYAFANSMQGSPLYQLMKAIVVRGLMNRRQWKDSKQKSTKKSVRGQAEDLKAPGYDPQEISSLGQVDGIMADVIEGLLYGYPETGTIHPLKEYLVDEEKQRGVIIFGHYYIERGASVAAEGSH